MLFDTHVAHAHFVNQLVDGHALGALERIDNCEPLGPTNFCD